MSERYQEVFIEKHLDSHVLCINQDISTPEDISTPIIKYILSKSYNNGADMQVVSCLFGERFIKYTKNKSKGLHNLSVTINEIISKLGKLDIKSSQGIVFVSELFGTDIKVIIKIPQKITGISTMIREYFLGLFAINKLRYYIPNFVYTLGGFICAKPMLYDNEYKICEKGKETSYVIYEYLTGSNITTLLKEKTISFEIWLLTFTQLLLALEIAQRELRFTHFDLHSGNVMLTDRNDSYKVPLDYETFYINSPLYTPVIIDFGHATAVVNMQTIGSYAYPKYGMMNYMIQGYDMYKFLVYSFYYASDENIKNKISQLFLFYGQNDPYRILFDEQGIQIAISEYCAKGTYSAIATYTPLMFLRWILNKKEYNKILSNNITVHQRVEYLPLQYSTNIYKYNDLLIHTTEGLNKAVEIVSNTIKNKPNYVMSLYMIKTLVKYNKKIKNKIITKKLNELRLLINDELMIIDMEMLEGVFDIRFPTQLLLEQYTQHILNIPVTASNKEKLKSIKNLDILFFQQKLEPYLQYYYTIIDTNTQEKFNDWIDRFQSSDIYLFSKKNSIAIERSIRWGQTLLASSA